MPFCVKCGHKVPDGASFCTACGAPLKKNISTPAPPTAAPPTAAPPTPAPPTPAPPTPPPPPGSQPGAFRVTIRKKEATPPPQRNLTPPPPSPTYMPQQQGFVPPNNAYNGGSPYYGMPRPKSGGSSFGGCFRRVFHGITAAIALFASLWWGVNSLFPNLRTDISGWTSGIFGSCSGGKHEGGGLFGSGGSEEKKEGMLASKEYDLAFEEGVTMQIIEEAGFPNTGGDNSLSYGTYETDQKMQGHTIAFKLEPTTNEDKRIIGRYVMLGDGNPVKQGVVCYCGHNLYAFYEDGDEDNIGHKASTDVVLYANPDGKSFAIYDKGEEKMKWSLKD